jgi:Cu-Zn family superoxide dismutase
MTIRNILLAGVAAFSLALAGCHHDDKDHHDHARAAAGAVAICNVEPTKGNSAKGVVTFTQKGDKVTIVAHISGLTANQKHGFHIQEGMECGEDGMLAKGHYNPDKHEHGDPGKDNRHAGDMGNLEANADGVAHLELTVDNISVNGAKNPVVGHAIIVHAKTDDFSQPVGNAGPRIGCGIIKISPK